MILVDSSALYALYVRSDQHHRLAASWYRSNAEPLITTNFIVAEAFTLLRSRHHASSARRLSARLRTVDFVSIEWVRHSDFEAAWGIFDEFADKLWSFVDCLSYIVISRLHITKAFAFDEHFRQFGIVEVVP